MKKPWALLTSDEKIERLDMLVMLLYWWLVVLTAVVVVLAVRSFS